MQSYKIFSQILYQIMLKFPLYPQFQLFLISAEHGTEWFFGAFWFQVIRAEFLLDFPGLWILWRFEICWYTLLQTPGNREMYEVLKAWWQHLTSCHLAYFEIWEHTQERDGGVRLVTGNQPTYFFSCAISKLHSFTMSFGFFILKHNCNI